MYRARETVQRRTWLRLDVVEQCIVDLDHERRFRSRQRYARL